MRSGFKGFSGFGFVQALMAAAFAASFIRPSKIKAVERRQGSRLNITRDGWKVNCHKTEEERRRSLAHFIDEYKANPMNYLPGRDTAKLMRIHHHGKMMNAARASLAVYRETGFCLDKVQPRSHQWNN